PYLQNGNATMRLIGLAIEAGTISSDIYTDRFAANDPAFDPHKEAEQQAMKKIMTPESGDPNAQSLFGAKRQLEERESSLTFRFNRLPPGASDILEAANDPDFELEYRPLAAGQDLTWPGRNISI